MPSELEPSLRRPSAVELKGPTQPFSVAQRWLLFIFVAVGLWLRLTALSAEGFGDDEIHKWLAANRYLHFDLSGDDVEHPMLMKSLIALCLAIGSRFSWQPETISRLPNAIAGGLSILAVAVLGRRLFGRIAAILAAGLAAVCCTFIGYQRVAKEDTLLGLFLMLVLWGVAEAKSAADDGPVTRQKRWEWMAALSLGAMLASKYFLFFAPIPVVCYLWLLGTGARWRIPWGRWALLTGGSFLFFAAINWTPFLPATWEYGKTYVTGRATVHGSLFFMGQIFHNLTGYWFSGTPPWFFLVFAAVKLAPATVLTAAGGLVMAVWQRRPAHRVLLSWIGVWFLILSASGSKWGRFFTSVLPAFLLLSGHFCAQLVKWVSERRAHPEAESFKTPVWRAALLAPIALLLWGWETQASLSHAPHYRLYISALGGGDRNVDWFFPHCDYFDAGFREAIAYVAAHAEPNAELSTEIDWPARFYADRSGRIDLLHTPVRREQACRQGRVCYVVVQTGRLYFQNQDAVQNLSRRPPWHVVNIRGHDVVKVYRLPAGESPFPGEGPAQTRISATGE